MLAAKSKRSRFSQETGTDGNSKPTPGPLILFESKLDVKFGAGRNSGPVCYGRARITVHLKCYRDAKRQLEPRSSTCGRSFPIFAEVDSTTGRQLMSMPKAR